jgi:hypothetical protein
MQSRGHVGHCWQASRWTGSAAAAGGDRSEQRSRGERRVSCAHRAQAIALGFVRRASTARASGVDGAPHVVALPFVAPAIRPLEGMARRIAKAPQPGRVKTRLSPPLSPTEAAELYRCLLLDVLDESAAAALLLGLDALFVVPQATSEFSVCTGGGSSRGADGRRTRRAHEPSRDKQPQRARRSRCCGAATARV